MPKVKITKQLDRPDGGKVASGCIAVCNNEQKIENQKAVVFITSFYLNETSYEGGKKSIPELDKFKSHKLIKMCSDEEWESLNDDAGSGLLVGTFMKECIDLEIGLGFTELID